MFRRRLRAEEPDTRGTPVHRIAVVVGTRPEAIKVASVIQHLRESRTLHPLVISTAQHGSVLDDALAGLGIEPDVDLGVHRPGQTLESVAGAVLTRLSPLLRRFAADAVVVQGDTASAFAGALAAFYTGTPLVHLEAGLRSGNRREPFPEEVHRRLISGLSDLHLAPTAHARDQLVAEGVPPQAVEVTGNTVLDPAALAGTAGAPEPDWFDARTRQALDGSRRLVLATVHRRESWGPPLARIAEALGLIADLPAVVVLLPLHPNPDVRATVTSRLAGHPSVVLTDWQPHDRFLALLRRAHLVLTDSGGVQEEAPSFGVPALVLRDVTDRPESIAAGLAQLVGTRSEAIVAAATRLLSDDAAHAAMRGATNPFGDGAAAPRCVAAIERLLRERDDPRREPATSDPGRPAPADPDAGSRTWEEEPSTPSSSSEAGVPG